MISFQKLINLTSICPHRQIVMPQRGNERRHGIMETRSNQPLWRLLTNKHGGVLYRGVFETDIHWQWIGMRSASKSFLHKTMCVQHFNLESSDYYKMQIYACSRKQKTWSWTKIYLILFSDLRFVWIIICDQSIVSHRIYG